ncbi:MAG: HD domain-containing phosphohydrolase [Anaerolineales bacterium]
MLSRLRQAYIPLFTQITVPYILLALAIAAGGTYIVTRLIFDSLEERFTNQLIATAILTEDSLVRAENDLLEALRVASHVQGVDLAVQAHDAAMLQQLVVPGAYNAGVEALAVLDSGGRPLVALVLNPEAQTYDPLQVSAPFRGTGFVQSVLSGQVDEDGDKFGGIVPTAMGDFLFIGGPIMDAQANLVGVALVGQSVRQLVNTAHAETLAQLTLYTLDGHVFASTLAEPSVLDPEESFQVIARQQESSLTRGLRDSDINYNEILSSWQIRRGEDIGLAGVALPTAFLVQASQFTRQNTLLLMGGALLLVVLVGLVIAGGIARPIRALRDAALQVSQGNLRVNVPARGRNEIGVLTQSFNDMVVSLHTSKRNLLDAYEKTIEGWAKATDLRDHATEGHSRRVADLSVTLAKEMGLGGEALVHLYRGALLHDIGKIAISDSILLKKGKLTIEERMEMQRHPELARSFMEQVDFLKPALDIPYAHHEKWDGSGYPRGLRGEEIPLAARIFAIVDVWDALTSDRPYRAAQGFDQTMREIEAQSGRHFDPQVVKAFRKLMGR